MKKVLALVGDYYQPSNYLSRVLKLIVKKEYRLDIYSNHLEIDWDGLMNYDILILATWGKINDPKDESYWINEYHEKRIDQFLAEGGRLFLIHSGRGDHPNDGFFRNKDQSRFIKDTEIRPDINFNF